MSENSQIIQKADIALADLSSNGGLLLPEQANVFLRKVLIQPTMLSQARVVPMNSPTRKINRIGFASRILRSGQAGVDSNGAQYTSADIETDGTLKVAQRAKPTTEQIELRTREVIAEIHLPYDVIEDNIERGSINAAGANAIAPPVSGGIKDTIMDMIAERAALDLEEYALLADTTLLATDPYLGMTDGWLKRCNQNEYNANSATISRTIFKGAIKALPTQYKRVLGQMRHYCSVNNEIEYRDTLAIRETSLGDLNLMGAPKAYAYGVPVEPVGLMSGAFALLTNPLNLIFGIQRQISLEVEKNIRGREFIIVLTARVAVQVEDSLAAVRTKNIVG